VSACEARPDFFIVSFSERLMLYLCVSKARRVVFFIYGLLGLSKRRLIFSLDKLERAARAAPGAGPGTGLCVLKMK